MISIEKEFRYCILDIAIRQVVMLFLLRVTTRINSDTPRSARKSTIDNSRPPSFSKVVKRVQKTSQEQLIEEAAEKERKQQAAQEAYQA